VEPRVDIIIPTHDRPDLTAKAVQSVFAQTYDGWRVILSDDASRPDTVRALRRLASHPRIVLVESRINKGPQAARQRGLDHSYAELVALLDSDDRWHPAKLQAQLDVLDDFDLVLCWHQWLDEGEVRAIRRPSGHGSLPPNLTTNMSTPLIRRRAIDEAGGLLPSGTPSLRTAEGIEFYVRLAKSATYTVAPQPLVDCLHHGNERSSGRHGTLEAANDLAYTVEKHAAFLARWPHDYSVLLARTASRYLEVGQISQGFDYMSRSIRMAPDTKRQLVLLRRFGPHAAKRLALTAIGR
jgi:glycosyltransferase involved in cell wall biosynthesis